MSDWQQRMALLRPYLNRFKRRFSVLDLGCGDGAVGRAIAREYDASVFLLDRDITEPIEYELPRVTLLKHNITPVELHALADCEHFGVVLALNFLHHFGSDWRVAVDATLRIGQHTFIQLPDDNSGGVAGRDILPQLTAHVGAAQATLLGYPNQHTGRDPRPLWVLVGPREKRLTGHVWKGQMEPLLVYASYDKIHKEHRGGLQPWHVGMNLWNLLRLGVVWPTKARLASLVRAFTPEQAHGDIIPWNFIWDGEALHLCDWNGQFQREDAYGLEQTARIVEMSEPKYPADMTGWA